VARRRLVKREIVLSVALVCVASCDTARGVDVVTVLSNGNCQTTEVGIREIDYATLATYGGAKLLDMTASNTDASAPLHLVAIVPGEFPTAGYTVKIARDPTLTADQLTLHVDVAKPPAGSMTAQVLTHPCMVVGIAEPAVRRVRAVDGDREIGSIELAHPAWVSRDLP
jgi:hypothetical protein